MTPNAVFTEAGIDKDYMYNVSVALTLWLSHLMTPNAVFRELNQLLV